MDFLYALPLWGIDLIIALGATVIGCGLIVLVAWVLWRDELGWY